MKITPILGRVLIKPIEEKQGTIIVPDNQKKQPTNGIIVKSSVSWLCEGDHVIWKDLTGIYIDDYILVNSSDILTVYDVLPGGDHSN